MVGYGVLYECLNNAKVEQVTTIGRTRTGKTHPKLREIEHKNLFDYTGITDRLRDSTPASLPRHLLRRHERGRLPAHHLRSHPPPRTIFGPAEPRHGVHLRFRQYIDSTEKGKSMWARVKGATENAPLRLPGSRRLHVPARNHPALHGARSKTPLYHFIWRRFLAGVSHPEVVFSEPGHDHGKKSDGP